MPTLTPEAQADWEAICRHPKMTVPCTAPPSRWGDVGAQHEKIASCVCHGTGRVALLLESCPEGDGDWPRHFNPQMGWRCDLCHGTGLVPKSFDALGVLTSLTQRGFGMRIVTDGDGGGFVADAHKSRVEIPNPFTESDAAAALLKAARRALEAVR